MQPDSQQQNGVLFKASFLRLLLDKFPALAELYLRKRGDMHKDRNFAAEPGWAAILCRYPPPDTVTVSPMCNFGLDYISTAQDPEERSDLVFAKVLTDIADFISGRTAVAIRRHKFLFMKAGWDVRFVPTTDMERARQAGASIIAWPLGR